MYVIGSSDYNFISFKRDTLYDRQYKKIEHEAVSVEYETPLHRSTIIANREDAEKILNEIRDRVDLIEFQNDSILGEILDRENSFDKGEFVKGLKIYELVPREVTE